MLLARKLQMTSLGHIALDGFKLKANSSMGKKGSGYQYSYNAQISVDSDNGIIVGQHISQHASDKQEVKPSLEAIAEATDNATIDKMSMDNGYYSGPGLQACDDENIDAYMATQQTVRKSLQQSDWKISPTRRSSDLKER